MKKIFTIILIVFSFVAKSQIISLTTDSDTLKWVDPFTNTKHRILVPSSSGSNIYYNVKDYGAVGDSTTDDRAAVVATIAAANAAGGGVIFFPAGRFRISDSIVLTKSVRIQGVIDAGGLNNNQSSALQDRFYPQQYITTIYSGTNKSIFILDTASDGSKPTIAVEYITFRGDTLGTATAGSFIKIKGNLQDVSISNCTFFGGWVQLYLQAAFYYKIQHCHFSAPTLYCVLLDQTIREDTGDGSITDCTFSSGTFTTTTETAIFWIAGGGRRVTNCKFDASLFTKNTQFLWDIDGGNTRSATSDWLISNNSFENAQVGSIRFNCPNSFQSMQISSNQFAPFASFGNLIKVIDITNVDNLTITDFVIQNYTTAVADTAIKISNSDNVLLNGGIIRDFTKSVVFISSTNTNYTGLVFNGYTNSSTNNFAEDNTFAANNYFAGVNTFVGNHSFTGQNTFSNNQNITASTNSALGLTINNTNNGNAAISVLKLQNDAGNTAQMALYGSGVAAANHTYFSSSKDFTIGTDHAVASGGTSKFEIYTGGYNNAANPNFQLSGAGALKFAAYGAGALTTDASGNVTAVSDERLKDIQGYYKSGLKELMKIRTIYYKWNKLSGNEMDSTYAGFSAQNVRDNIPYGTGINKDGYLSLQDRAILATVTNSVQELYEIILKQQAEIDQLKKIIKKNK